MRFTPGQTTQKTPTATPTKPATQETKPELHRPDRVRDRVESYLRRPDKYKPIPGIIPLFPSKTNPGKDFWTTRDGLNLYSAAENNANLRNYFRRHQGLSSSRKTDSVINYLTDNYYKIKFHPRVSWAIVDMETGKMVGWQVNRNFEGASVVKVWPMASLFDKMGGFPNASQIATMLQMIAVSSNSAWSQTIYYNADQGGGNKAKSGYHRIQQFLKKYGYTKTKGGRISIGAGQSAINTRDLTHYLFDLNHNRLPGSEAQLKLMATCRTANKKGFRYAPSGVFGGGKTGTYSQLAHDLRWYEINGKRYGIAVLTQLSASPGYSGSPSGSNNFRNESVAILHGGLLREYIYTNLGAVFPTTASEKKEFWQGNYNGGIAKVKDGEKPSL
jgi:hypothetical protein